MNRVVKGHLGGLPSLPSWRTSVSIFTLIQAITVYVFVRAVPHDALGLAVLPGAFALLFVLGVDLRIYVRNPGAFVMVLIASIRFVVLPALIVSSDTYMISHGSLRDGIALMVYELLLWGAAFRLVMRDYRDSSSAAPPCMGQLHNRNGLVKLIVFASVAVVAANPALLTQYSLTFGAAETIEVVRPSSVAPGLPGLILGWGRLLLPLLASMPLLRLYERKRRVHYLFFAALVLVGLSVMFFSGSSRNSALLPGVASMFFLLRVFTKHRRLAFLALLSVMIITTVVLTQFKLNYTGGAELDSLEDYISYGELYFAGPSSLAVSVMAYEWYRPDVRGSTLIADVFGNMPGVAGIVDLEDRTSSLYNRMYYGGGPRRDQILPFVGQSAFHLGYLLVVLPIVGVTWVMSRMDRAYRRTTDTTWLFVSAFLGVRLGMAMMSNISILMSFAYSVAVPLGLVVYLNRRLSSRSGLAANCGRPTVRAT